MAAAASAAASSDKPQLASAADAAKWAAKLRKVHLHLHIDGSVRVGTLFEYGRKRGRLPAGVQTEAQLAPLVQVPSDCQSLVQYLTAFGNLLPLVRGDLEAVERIGFELCQDQHRDGVVYFEGRFAPHLFAEGQVRCLSPGPRRISPLLQLQSRQQSRAR
jgi:adenosine deaminase